MKEVICINKEVSQRVSQISYPKIREIFDRARTYDNVISLGIGEPDFDTDRNIINQAFQSVVEKKATHYTPVAGYPELREAIALKYWKENGLKIDKEEIIVTHGAQHALMIAMLTLLDAGDEILMPDPFYPSYTTQAFLSGATPVFVPTLEKDNFKLKPESIIKKISEKSKVLILNTPNNPTGAVLEKNDLEEISKLVIKHDLMVIADEAYETMIYDDKKHFCIAGIPGMKERTITINSFSKRYAMTGWRIGYAMASKKFISNMMKISGYHLSCPCAVSQQAALAALNSSSDIIKQMNAEYRKRRNYFVRELNKIKGISCIKPEGAFYIFANIKGTGRTSEEFYDELLTKVQVVVIPGSAFGKQGEGYVRIAYTLPINKLEEVINRIKTLFDF
jgi:aminotransferase